MVIPGNTDLGTFIKQLLIIFHPPTSNSFYELDSVIDDKIEELMSLVAIRKTLS